MSPFEIQLLVYFLYGLTFFSLGLVMLLESWRLLPGAPQIGLIRPLAAFGLLHGAHEWLEIFLVQMERFGEPIAGQMIWVRLGLLAVSFVALWVYSLAAFRFAREHISPFTIFGLITLPLFGFLTSADVLAAWLQGSISPVQLVGGIVRYGLGVVGAAVATLGLNAAAFKARADQRQPLDRFLHLTALGFGLYSLTQVFVPEMSTTLATWLNAENFRTWTGLPIQSVRTLTAMIITLGLFSAIRFLEMERQAVVANARQAQLEALEQKETLRRELLRHTVRAQEEERAHIARELHDELAQTLTAFSLDLGTLETMLKKNTQARPILHRLNEHSRQMSQNMYRMVRALRPAHLDDLGLEAAVRFMLAQEFESRGLSSRLEVRGAARRLDPVTETVLFRIAQEALTNVHRHARASLARVVLSFEQGFVQLQVSDNGQGFESSLTAQPAHGWGLAGMKERAESVGGRLKVISSPGAGTEVEVQIPTASSPGGA